MPSSAAPLASLTIPAFREGARLPRLLEALVSEGLTPGAPPVELLVVDDGSDARHRDRERAAVESAASRLAAGDSPHRVRFIAGPANRGKGAAVRLGWAQSHPGARWLGFLDADGAVSAQEAWRLLRKLEGDPPFDVLAGTRMLMAGRTICRSLLRHLQGRIFATLTELAFGLGFYDTQCGLKLVRAELLRPLLPELREERWLLDVELLVLLQGRGARCVEEPVDWVDPGGSKMVPGADALRMGAGLWHLKRRLGGERITA